VWGKILDWFSDAFAWLLDGIKAVLELLWDALLGALAGVLEAIPVPAWADSGAGAFGSMHPTVVWLVEPMQLDTGLTIILAAYGIRFLVRRIPLIG
jgi:hypothetical protein